MIIGTCSICHGPVATYDGPWEGTQKPIPTCMQCGAAKKNPHGPIVDMEPCKPPAHPHPMDHLRPFPFETLPPIDSIKDAIEWGKNKSRAIGIGTKLGDLQYGMGGAGIHPVEPGTPEKWDKSQLTASQEDFLGALDKALPGLKGSISVRRINLGD